MIYLVVISSISRTSRSSKSRWTMEG